MFSPFLSRSVDDFVQRKLDDARSSVLRERRNEIAHKLLFDDGFDGEPLFVVELVDGRRMESRKGFDDLVERLGRSVAFEQNAALCFKCTRQEHLKLFELRALRFVLPACLIGDETRRGREDGVDDAQIVGAKGGASLGQIDDCIDELRSLDFRRAPAELDIRLDAVLLEVALDEADRLRGNALAVEILDALDLGIVRHGENPAHGIGRGLRVVELADFLDVAAVFVNPIVTADTGIKKPELDIAAHFLRTEKAAFDFLVVDGRDVAAAGARHIEARALEEREG